MFCDICRVQTNHIASCCPSFACIRCRCKFPNHESTCPSRTSAATWFCNATGVVKTDTSYVAPVATPRFSTVKGKFVKRGHGKYYFIGYDFIVKIDKDSEGNLYIRDVPDGISPNKNSDGTISFTQTGPISSTKRRYEISNNVSVPVRVYKQT